MAVTLNFAPEQEAGLIAEARACGKTVEAYLMSMVENTLPFAKEGRSAEQRALAFEAWATGHKSTPPLSDYAVSREGIYESRDGA